MESKGVYLNKIPEAGEITLLAAVIDKEIRPKRNGGSYLALRLADRSAELDAKVWADPEAVAQLFATSDVVKVRGTVEHYNDKPQLIVSRIRRCEPHDVSDFYPASRRDPEEMFGELQAIVAMIRDDSLIESIVNDAAISDRLRTAAFMKLLDAGQDWSVRREEFRSALLQRVAKTLLIHTPKLSKESAGDIAQIVVLNVKAVVTHQAFFGSASSTADEFRDMTRLYLRSRLGSSVSGKKGIPS